jgi:hypothetical protein
MRKQAWIIIFILSSGCSSCLNGFYGTNSHEYLDIVCVDTSLNDSLRDYYFDSVLYKNSYIPDSIKSKFYISDVQTDLHEGDKLIHFQDKPEEWYLVELEGEGQSVIKAIYSPDISVNAIFDKIYLTERQITRIRNRMRTEVLEKLNRISRIKEKA